MCGSFHWKGFLIRATVPGNLSLKHYGWQFWSDLCTPNDDVTIFTVIENSASKTFTYFYAVVFSDSLEEKLNIENSHIHSFSFSWRVLCWFKSWSIKASYTSLKRIIRVFSAISILLFYIFRTLLCFICRHQLNFAVAFRVNDGKYQNILSTPVFVNFKL